MLKGTGKLTCKFASPLIDPSHKLGLVKEETSVDIEIY